MSRLIHTLVVCLLPWSGLTKSLDYGDIEMEGQFNDFMQTFNRDYENEGRAMRFEIFKENVRKAVERNGNIDEEIYGITKFSDWTAEEFQTLLGTNPDSMESSNCPALEPSSENVPDTLDYVALGKVSPVKNQENCGSCWAFSTTSQIESQVLIKHNQQILLSEQQLVDCDELSSGCGGTTSLSNGYEYFIENGAEQEQDYSYQGDDDQCQYDGSKVAVNVTACNTYEVTEEDSLKNVLNQAGPVTLAVAAADWHSYDGGIMKDCDNTNVDHAVLLVGYGTEEGVDFWVVKNSWGADWGENGYIRLQRGSNQCQLINAPAVGSTVA